MYGGRKILVQDRLLAAVLESKGICRQQQIGKQLSKVSAPKKRSLSAGFQAALERITYPGDRRLHR